MAFLSGFNITLSDVSFLGKAALASAGGGPVPDGWSVVTPQQLGVPPNFWDGNYFTNNGASAIVLRQGNSYVVAFRGTDGTNDVAQYPNLANGSYINSFSPLLSAIASNVPGGSTFSFTGASLGGGATNQMADIASSQYGGRFAGATFVAFASPNISNANGILNVGAENDPVFKAINNYGDFPSSVDSLVLATSQYMAGNYDGRHPFDAYAHNAKSVGFDGLERISNSVFLNQMTTDSTIVVVAHSFVQDITPGRENTGAFYLGQVGDDHISGRNGSDFIEGFGSNDSLTGGGGDDFIDGGLGVDTAVFSGPRSSYSVTHFGGGVRVSGPDGTDTLTTVELMSFSDGIFSAQGQLPHNDFNGDDKSDILWRHDNGTPSIWHMNGPQIQSTADLPMVANDWKIADTGDFNGDGKVDILWRNDNGTPSIWQMNGNQIQSNTDLPKVGTEWHVAGLADFNGDGRSDILWQHFNGTNSLWQMNGGQIQANVNLPGVGAGWHIMAPRDFTGDGDSDILWRHDSGLVSLWQLNDGQLQSNTDIAAVATNWHILETGDFNGDGKNDVVWRHDNGLLSIWQMNGAQIQAISDLPTAGNDWKVVGTADFNGDGQGDIQWRHNDGRNSVWQMNNGGVQTIADLPTVGNEWQVVTHFQDFV